MSRWQSPVHLQKNGSVSVSCCCCEVAFTCGSSRHEAACVYMFTTLISRWAGEHQMMHGPSRIRVIYQELRTDSTCKAQIERSEGKSEEMFLCIIYVFIYLCIYVIWCMFAVTQEGQGYTVHMQAEYKWPGRFIKPSYNSDFLSSQIMSPDSLKMKDPGSH